MANFCDLCGKKLGVFGGSYYGGIGATICDNCNEKYGTALDCINNKENFKNALAELEKEASNKETLDRVVAYLMELHQEKILEIEERERQKAEELAEQERQKAEELAEQERQKAEEERQRLENERLEKERQKRIIELEKKERERRQKEFDYKIENLKKMGMDGYYEYKVISLHDDNAGGIYSYSIESQLNELGLDGWHLKCAYSNELGKNSNSGGIGGFTTGTNSTIDQNILIFERFVRFDN